MSSSWSTCRPRRAIDPSPRGRRESSPVASSKAVTFGGRWALLALLFATLGSSLARVAHFIAVPHRLCEIHGTIEHGADPLVQGNEPAGLPEAGHPRVVAGDAPHEECGFGPCARVEALPSVTAEIQVRLVPERRTRVLVPDEPDPSIPILRLAPSRSPPV
jgi:hypothetical protein